MPNQIFLISIAVLEGRHYVWENMDSAVVIRIDNYQKTTAVKKNSSSPYYNEYFVFEFYTTLEALLNKNIRIMLIQPCNVWRKRKLLGEIMLDVATVWYQKNHQFYHKWAILSGDKTETYVCPRGYLKVDICILAKGEVSKMPTNVVNDNIEGNLLLPEGKYGERQKATYIFDIYSCQNIIDNPSSSLFEDRRGIQETKKHRPSLYLEITFAGVSARTSTKKNASRLDFNERLSIVDLFPPLCQSIKIEACYADKLRKTVHSQKVIELKHISNEKEGGFLPTLGPTFLYLYFNNVMEGFAGTILMAIDTKLDEGVISEVKKGIKIENIAPLEEKKYFEAENIIIFASLSDLTAINKKFSKKEICVRMTFGSTLNHSRILPDGRQISMNTTDANKPKKIDKNHFYIDYFTRNPCLWIFQEVPYYKKRSFNSNMLYKISTELSEELLEIEKLLEDDNSTESTSLIINQKISKVTDFIATSANKYVDIFGSYKVNYLTKLDIERRRMCLQEMSNIADSVIYVDSYESNKQKFRVLHKILDRINRLIDDVQDCWPHIIIWLVYGRKKVACFKVLARDVIYSPIPEEKGRFCGVRRTICFYKNPLDNSKIAAKMDVTMFLCIEKHKMICLKEITTTGPYLLDELDLIPRYLVPTDKQTFHLRCYIFQGKIISGFDHSGLSDPFVRIVLQNMLQETQVIENSLNPVWDQTLVFNEISFNEFDPPTILFEVLDKDEFGKIEFIGRSLIKPQIKFAKKDIKLEWHPAYRNDEVTGEILAGFEYVKGTDISDLSSKGGKFNIPKGIKPNFVPHKLEILFWGIRKPGKLNLMPIRRPRITVLCGDSCLNSDILEDVLKEPNFLNQSKHIELSFPDEKEFAPPLRLKMFESKKFGIYAFAGIHITKMTSFIVTPMTKLRRQEKLSKTVKYNNSLDSDTGSLSFLHKQNLKERESPSEERKKKYRRSGLLGQCCKYFWSKEDKNNGAFTAQSGIYEPLTQEDDQDLVEYDWWRKYYDSINVSETLDDTDMKHLRTLKIYESELESQAEFKGFTDILTSFPIFKGKRTGDEIIDQENVTGIFKGSVGIYKYPYSEANKYVFSNGIPLELGYFHQYPENHQVRYLLRVYCIRALNLRPKDLNGKSDPYIILSLNNQEVDDKEHYIPNNVNPVFGRCFEFNAVFPQDYLLKIAIWDYDTTSADDLIGETEIDLENRYYTKHMAFCGIAETYEEFGYCTWRGQHKPTCILLDLCQKWNVGLPDYKEKSVQIGYKEFLVENFISSGDYNYDREVLSLFVLRHWKEMPLIGFSIVPEHVETRSLFHPSKPGIEQGKLQMWIDIFPIVDIPPPEKVNISLRKPTAYELRVIIWNTEEVVLDEDDFISGEKKSDIYVKGWLVDSLQPQYTDVHYRSLTGEGNFNWRFIFNFDYLHTENKIVIRKKESLFSVDQTEFKIPCILTLQAWDNDTFSRDDFLGTLNLELAKMYKPSKTVKTCTMKIVEKGAPTMNLFKIRRTRGWWPFKAGQSENQICTGKVEAELELYTLEEALKEPAGVGRHEPQPLPPPNRPDTSFSWFKNPFKAIQYVICKLHKWKMIMSLCFIMLCFFVTTAIFAFPGYTVKKFLGA